MAIAHGGLRHLGHEGLRVTQQQALDRTGAIEFLHDQAPLETVSLARGLHNRRAGSCISTHEQRNADYAFIAYARNLGRCARFGNIVKRYDRGGWKVCMLQLAAWSVKHVT